VFINIGRGALVSFNWTKAESIMIVIRLAIKYKRQITYKNLFSNTKVWKKMLIFLQTSKI